MIYNILTGGLLKLQVGSDASCTKPICCRDYADHVGPILEPAEPFGNHRCDSPPDLAQSLLSAIQEFGGDAAFAIFTGDVVEGQSVIGYGRKVHISRVHSY